MTADSAQSQMLMGDLPGATDLAQLHRQAQARRAVLGELLLRAPQRGNAVANATVSPAVTSSSAISKVPSPFSCQSKNGGHVSR
jgi:hypothetical protein